MIPPPLKIPFSPLQSRAIRILDACRRRRLIILLFASLTLQAYDFSVTGVVADSRTHSGLANVEISVLNEKVTTISDAYGRFSFSIDQAEVIVIQFKHIGYVSREVDYQPNPRGSGYLHVTLNPRIITLPAVEIQGISTGRNLALPPRTFYRYKPDELSRQTTPRVSDLLANIPDVSVKSSAPGQPVQISLRGSQSDQVLILLNGQPLRSAGTGQFDLNQIPVASISEIQVAPGNQSARYGNQAMGGVVNLILRPSIRKSNLKLNLSRGSFGLNRGRVSATWNRPAWSSEIHLTLSGVHNRYPFQSSGEAGIRENAGGRQQSLWLTTNYHPKSAWRWEGIAFKALRQQQLPGPIFELTPDAHQLIDQNHILSNLTLAKGSWQFASRTSWDARVQEQQSRLSVMGGYHNQIQTSTREQNISASRQFSVGVLACEANWEWESLNGEDRLRPRLSLGNQHRQIREVAGSATGRFKLRAVNFIPDLVVREHAISTGQAMTTWQAGAQLEKAAFTTWLRTGTGFRLPNFWELFWVPDAYATGNPDLKPERSRDREFGIHLEPVTRWQIGFTGTVFHQAYGDLISWTRGYANRYYPENLERAAISGYSLSVTGSPAPDHLTAGLNYTRTNPRNRSPDPTTYNLYLPYRALSNLNFDLQWRKQTWSGHISSQVQGRTYIRAANTKWLDGFQLWNISLSRRFRRGSVKAVLNLAINNVSDQHYEVLERYPLPGRQFVTTLNIEY